MLEAQLEHRIIRQALELEHQTNRRRELQRVPQTNQVRVWQQPEHRIQRRVLLLRVQQHQREMWVRPVWRVLRTQQEQQLENQREVRLVLRVCSLRWRRIQSS